MPVIKIRRGLDLPIEGAPTSNVVEERLDVARVGLVPSESHGLKCRPLVAEGDRVEIGSALFVDRRDPDVVYTSPASGTVVSVQRGARRAVLSITVERDGKNTAKTFATPRPGDGVDVGALRASLQESGLWSAIRQRPYDRVPAKDAVPAAIFVTAIDTRPLAPRPLDVLAGRTDAFRTGLDALRRLTEGRTYLCVGPGDDWSAATPAGVETVVFAGPHPAGTPGLHIHKLHPVGHARSAWHVGYQDVADIGAFLSSGRVPHERVVAITGPAAVRPRLVRTQRGACTEALLRGEADARRLRAVSGSVLEGRDSSPGTPTGYLGRYANQVTLLEDDPERRLLAWAMPIDERYTQTNTLFDKFVRKRFSLDTDTNGSLRAIVPLGQYEAVMPMDVLPTQLVKALATGDIELAEQLGALELAEEDLALCQFVDVSKQPITEWLREMLTRIEKES
ncbi:MAG: NADH:ubiquinone reductase (Na(+)-transporting) subunit A [Planctomycetota bacterium]